MAQQSGSLRWSLALLCACVLPGVEAIAIGRRRLSLGLANPIRWCRGGGGGPITEAEVAAAQKAWGDSLVEIGRVYRAGGDYAAVAKDALDRNYGYASGLEVLFKPTKASEVPIRLSETDALSYFVGGVVAADKGFALQPWTAVRWENAGSVCGWRSSVSQMPA